MNRLLPGITLLFAFLFIHCGTLPKGERYYDHRTPGYKLVSGGANFIIEETPDHHFILQRFYYETRQKTAEISFSDLKNSVMDGPAKQWLDDGRLWTEGYYDKGKRTGLWKAYSFTGSNQGGYGIGSYAEGEKTGTWALYDSLGRQKREIQFEKDQAIGFKTFGPEAERIEDKVYDTSISDTLQIVPEFPCDPKFADTGKACGKRSLTKYMAEKVKYPESAREKFITGTAYVSFVVEKDGQIKDFKVLQGISDAIKAECYALMAGMPNWTPGYSHGAPVKVNYLMPIRFKL